MIRIGANPPAREDYGVALQAIYAEAVRETPKDMLALLDRLDRLPPETARKRD